MLYVVPFTLFRVLHSKFNNNNNNNVQSQHHNFNQSDVINQAMAISNVL